MLGVLEKHIVDETWGGRLAVTTDSSSPCQVVIAVALS